MENSQKKTAERRRRGSDERLARDEKKNITLIRFHE